MSNRRWYRESFRKLCIYTYFRRSIQVFCKFTFYTLISITISKYIWLYVFLCFKCFIYCCMLLSCKYFTIILTFKLVIRNMINYHSCFLFLNQPCNLRNKLFRIIFIHVKFILTDSFEDSCYRSSCKYCCLCHLADQIIFYLAGFKMRKCCCIRLCTFE